MITPKFKTRSHFRVLGVEDDAYKIDEVDPGFNDLWMNRFMSRHDEVACYSTDGTYYAVWFGAKGTDISVGKHLAGMAVTAAAEAPYGWVTRDVPAANYAVFRTTLRDVGSATEYAIDEWLPRSGYELDAGKPRFDLMPPGTTGPDSPVSVWIPVKAKA